MLLFTPGDKQVYHYYAKDSIEVYWVHFTVNQVIGILEKYGFPSSCYIKQCGVNVTYKDLFLKMITELQLCKPYYEEHLSLLLQEILLLTQRNT